MVISEIEKMTGLKNPGFSCIQCHEEAVIEMLGYGDITLCTDCALQLVLILSEDLCASITKGGRHG